MHLTSDHEVPGSNSAGEGVQLVTVWCFIAQSLPQGSHRLEKYLKMKGSLEKSLKTKFVLKSP